MNTLHEELTAAQKFSSITKEIPLFVSKHINPNFEIRPYQQEALGRFFYFMEDYKDRNKPTQLLFNMATGSGKTLIMASSMLYLYEQGYRNFIFFVNSTSIIEKTKDNFLNNLSSKYLFSTKINFNGKEVKVNALSNFELSNPDDINIIFTTIQGLHSSLNTPKENAITYEDFEDKKIVLLADEAHHINALTKSKLSKEESAEKNSWENTVTKIFESHRDNLLLEFTATIDLEDENILNKYSDKLIYKYNLKEFREDLYSKDVKVLAEDTDPMYRALGSLLLSQYRLKIAEKYGLFIKPTILMKSKNIKESLSFEEDFHLFISKLSGTQLEEVRESGKSTQIIAQAFSFFEDNQISLGNLATEMREAFSVEKTISVNSKNDTDEKQLIINSLEDENNQIRVIFAVDKLNEGWDVLNLFDIVRLYETRDGKNGQPGKTTMAEAQLIGRGARYFPFSLNGEDKYKRKYDLDASNELRVLEELYYHSQQDSRYISELNKALVQTGIKADTTVQRDLKIKDSFKQTDFWKYGKIFLNEKRENTRDDIFGLDDKVISTKHFSYKLRTGSTQSISVFDEITKVNGLSQTSTKEKSFELTKDFGQHIIMKAMQKLNFYKFSSLKKYFPKLTSAKEFINDDKYLNTVLVEVSGTQDKLEALSAEDKLNITMSTLSKIEKEVMANNVDYKGTEEFKLHQVSTVFKDRTITVYDDQEKARGMLGNPNQLLELDLGNKDWYIHTENYGTDQEKLLVKFISNYIDELQDAFEEVYLLRNEKDFKIFDFLDGQAFEPDFVLFLKEKKEKELITYQLFIEPKGEHLLEHDEWKEKFLKTIKDKYEIAVKFENQDFKLFGLPFFNKGKRDKEFSEKFKQITKIVS